MLKWRLSGLFSDCRVVGWFCHIMLCHLKLMRSQTVNSQWEIQGWLISRLCIAARSAQGCMTMLQLRRCPHSFGLRRIHLWKQKVWQELIFIEQISRVPCDTDVCFCRLANQMPVLSIIIILQLSLRRNVCLQSVSLIDPLNLFYDLSLSTRCKAKIVTSYQCQCQCPNAAGTSYVYPLFWGHYI